MRIVTRPDFDGVVCAVLLYDANDIAAPVKWVEPSEIQKGLADIRSGDILANLPYNDNCAMWFDHHYTNRIETPFEGAFKISPSAAGVIYEYYNGAFQRNFAELVRETDKIDAADLSLDEVRHPENYPYILLSMTISNQNYKDEAYWNRLVSLLGSGDIRKTLADPDVAARCNAVAERNKIYKERLKAHTKMIGHVAVTDFRSFDETPTGNRFLVYSMFPDSVVNVRIRYDDENRDKIAISVGHSIFNRGCNVNAGRMLSKFEGGGHAGAGSCRVPAEKGEEYLQKIIGILLENTPEEDTV